MAITKIDNCPAYMDIETAEVISLESISANATVGFPCPAEDYASFFMFKGNGTNASTLTIYVGNGIQGTGDDLSITLGKDDIIMVPVYSGNFKFVSGEYKGCYKVKSTTACTAMLFCLPAGKQTIA